VLVCLLPFRRFDGRARLFISWCGLRGAAPIVLATYPMLAGVPNAKTLFDVVLIVVLASSVIQGPLLSLIGRRLGVEEDAATAAPADAVPAHSA
jgi:potassium/hydrogen antiporter